MIKSIIYWSCLSLTLTVSLQLVSGEKFEPASNLRPDFVEINKALIAALPEDENPETNFAEATKLYDRESLEFGKKHSLLRALKLFVSLEKTVVKCDTESAIILVANYQANEEQPKESTGRTFKIFDHYRSMYAAACRPYFQKKFKELVQNVKDVDRDQVKHLFGAIMVKDFNPLEIAISGYLDDSLRMQDISIVSAPIAVKKVLGQIGAQLKKVPDLWDSVNHRVDEGDITCVKLSPVVLEKYLFKPCANFREQLAQVLDPARLDYVLQPQTESEEFRALKVQLNEDKMYLQALIRNRFCETLQQHDNIYKVFSEAWKEYIDPNGILRGIC